MDNSNSVEPFSVDGLDFKQIQRVMLHQMKQHPDGITKEDLIAEVDIIDDWYRQHITDSAAWKLWLGHQVEFHVDETGEIVISVVDE